VRRMPPLPLSKVKRFSDYDGLWWLGVECRCCEHSRQIPAEFFARLYGRGAVVATTVRRLYCAPCRAKRCKCGSKNLGVRVGMNR
jgi:hypothetical protein